MSLLLFWRGEAATGGTGNATAGAAVGYGLGTQTFVGTGAAGAAGSAAYGAGTQTFVGSGGATAGAAAGYGADGVPPVSGSGGCTAAAPGCTGLGTVTPPTGISGGGGGTIPRKRRRSRRAEGSVSVLGEPPRQVIAGSGAAVAATASVYGAGLLGISGAGFAAAGRAGAAKGDGKVRNFVKGDGEVVTKGAAVNGYGISMTSEIAEQNLAILLLEL